MTAPKPPPAPPPSGDGDSPEALARRFLDLWQEHWTATLTDPETLRGWAALFDPAHAGRWLAGLAGHGPTGPAGDDTPRPPAAAAAPGRGGIELDERDRRLAALEQRVAQLESALAGAAAPRRRTPRKTGA